uniref:Radical SAM protein n=1 Tax=candidate division CPR3 bacterium TaxID=2268181 RepID=A0A7V3J961_UNCC3
MGNFEKVFSLNLKLTSRCNLACRYCPNEKTDDVMRNDVIAKGVDWFRNFGKWRKNSYNYIELSGGEVTLVPQKLEYAFRIIDDDIIVKVITNGTGFKSSWVRKIFEKNADRLDLIISVDGNREKHDYNRKTLVGGSSWDLIDWDFVFGTKWHSLTASLVCTLNNVDSLMSRVMEAKELGFSSVGISVDHTLLWPEEKLLEYEIQLCQLLGKMRRGEVEIVLFRSIDSMKSCGVYCCKCTDGYYSEYTVLEDGRVTPCKGFSDVFGRMIGWDVKYGDITNWVDKDFGFSWNVDSEDDGEECKNCISRYRCGCIPVRIMKYNYKDNRFDSICKLNRIEDKVWNCWNIR